MTWMSVSPRSFLHIGLYSFIWSSYYLLLFGTEGGGDMHDFCSRLIIVVFYGLFFFGLIIVVLILPPTQTWESCPQLTWPPFSTSCRKKLNSSFLSTETFHDLLGPDLSFRVAPLTCLAFNLWLRLSSYCSPADRSHLNLWPVLIQCSYSKKRAETA